MDFVLASLLTLPNLPCETPYSPLKMSVFSLFRFLIISNYFLHKNINIGGVGWNLLSIQIPTFLLTSEEIMSLFYARLFTQKWSQRT